MSWKTPHVEGGLLREPHHTQTIALGSAAWFAWLAEEQHHCFHFTHRSGEFTARKERKQRGDCYWVAYRQLHCKLHKVYLGKTEAMSEEHLIEAAQLLAQGCKTRTETG